MIVYIITTKSRKVIKIGMTRDLDIYSRLNALKTTSPEDLEIVEVLLSTGSYNIEKILHMECARWKMNREWFYLNNDCINHLKSVIDKLILTKKVMVIQGITEDATNKTTEFNPIGLDKCIEPKSESNE